MEKLLDTVKDFLNIHKATSIGDVITILFYVTLVLFLLFWIMEIPLKIGRKVLRKPHYESKPKKVSRIAFKTTLFGKLTYFCLLLFLCAAKAIGAKVFFEKYIKTPKNIIELIKNDKVFLVIFSLVIVYEVYFRKRKTES